MKNNCAVVTVADRSRRGFELLRESCRRQNISLNVLGMDTHFKGYLDKPMHLEKFLEHDSGDYTHILFCDAYDVVFSVDLDTIFNRYMSMNSPIVFSAEKNCWPDPNLAGSYPAVPSPYRFLNSGLWIGERILVKEMIRQLSSEVAKRTFSDQLLYSRTFLNKQVPITLDYNCALFQSLYNMLPDELAWDGSKLRNNVTGENPLIFHGNGRSNMYFVLSKLNLIPDFDASLDKACKLGQMTRAQYSYIADLIISIPQCTVLMVGVGHDAELWYNCSKGNVTYVEDDERYFPQLPPEVIRPNYRGRVGKWLESVKTPFAADARWDVVIVDGPHGYRSNDPGRQESLAWAAKVAKVAVLVHDYERPWERQVCDYYLGAASHLVPSDKENRLLAMFDMTKCKQRNHCRNL